MPISRMARPTSAGGTAIAIPNASSRSALPQRLDMERLPCLATRTPAPAATNAAMVEILKVDAQSPPVPQVSSSGSPPGPQSMGAATSRMARANPTSSSTLSPFIRKATRNAAIWGWLAWPQFLHALALHTQGHQKRGDLGLARLAGEDR